MKRTYEDMWFAKDPDICETCLDAFHITGTYISQGFSCSSPVGRAGLLMPEVLTACSTAGEIPAFVDDDIYPAEGF